jgi:methylenetetrahydrofolate reductase (NADPH)
MHNKSSIKNALEMRKPLFSIEFFPPQNEAGGKRMLDTADKLRPYKPDFVSITYGAGGGTRETTMKYAKLLQNDYGFEVMPHLTCVGHRTDELLGILEEFAKAGFRNVMALRGDPPKGENAFKPVKGGLTYGSDLVNLIKENFPHFGIGVGGYPEKHPESPNLTADLKNLKTKVDAGADFITTQLFFQNQAYFNFVEECKRIGITIPILPGLLPILSLAQVKRFCSMCGAGLPVELENQLNEANEDEHPKIGSEWATQQVRSLLKKGAPGFHIYALNKSKSTVKILQSLQN